MMKLPRKPLPSEVHCGGRCACVFFYRIWAFPSDVHMGLQDAATVLQAWSVVSTDVCRVLVVEVYRDEVRCVSPCPCIWLQATSPSLPLSGHIHQPSTLFLASARELTAIAHTTNGILQTSFLFNVQIHIRVWVCVSPLHEASRHA